MKVVAVLVTAAVALRMVQVHPWLLVVGVAVLVVALGARTKTRSVVVGGADTATAPRRTGNYRRGGTSKFIGRHEAGHYHVFRHIGGRDVWVEADREGGACYGHGGSRNPVDRIAMVKAGEHAVGSHRYCGIDDDRTKAILRSVPHRDRERVLAEGHQLARRLVRKYAAEIRRDGDTIARTGVLQ